MLASGGSGNAWGLEASWLSIIDTALYNNEPESVDARRVIAELGTTCARESESLQRDVCLRFSATSGITRATSHITNVVVFLFDVFV